MPIVSRPSRIPGRIRSLSAVTYAGISQNSVYRRSNGDQELAILHSTAYPFVNRVRILHVLRDERQQSRTNKRTLEDRCGFSSLTTRGPHPRPLVQSFHPPIPDILSWLMPVTGFQASDEEKKALAERRERDVHAQRNSAAR